MKSKILCLFVMFMLLPILSTVGASNHNGDVEIRIYANHLGGDIGTWVIVHVVNHKPENVTVYETWKSNYLFRNIFDGEWTSNYTVEDESKELIGKSILGWGIDFFTITVECEGASVTRNGVMIGINLVILFK